MKILFSFFIFLTPPFSTPPVQCEVKRWEIYRWHIEGVPHTLSIILIINKKKILCQENSADWLIRDCGLSRKVSEICCMDWIGLDIVIISFLPCFPCNLHQLEKLKCELNIFAYHLINRYYSIMYISLHSRR